ncbi:MAG: glycosyltransferase family 4 protein [Myxococcota bacterium]
MTGGTLDALHVMASGARAGGADHVLRLLVELRAAGLTCAAAVSHDGPLAEQLGDEGFPVHRVELMRSRFDPTAPWQLGRLLRHTTPRVVHYHGTRAAFFGAWSRRLGGAHVPTVYSAHGLSFRRVKDGLRQRLFVAVERLACAAADAVICVSQADLVDLRARGLVRAAAYHVPNGVDLQRFTTRPQSDARARLGLPAAGRVVGTVARLAREKGVGITLAAMSQVQDVTLVVVGDGPERSHLEREAQRRGLHARFLGERADIAELLPAFDVFVLSSLWEGEPVAVLEAMACGIPVVASATTGARELLRDGETGRVVPIGDAEALAAAVTQLLSTPDERRQLAAAARTSIARRSHASTARGVLEVYRALLADC